MSGPFDAASFLSWYVFVKTPCGGGKVDFVSSGARGEVKAEHLTEEVC